MADYLLQEDGVGRFILEDGSGDILLESQAVAGVGPYGSPILDSFDRADASTLGANWSPVFAIDGYPDFGIASHVAVPELGGAFASDVWNVAAFGPDCEVFATVVGGAGWLLARRGLSEPPYAGYSLLYDTVHMYLRNSAGAQLGANIDQPVNPGDRVALACRGSNIEAWVDVGNTGTWALAGTRTDTNTSGAGYIGIYSNNDSAATFDDFGGGTIVTSPSQPGGGIAVAPRRFIREKVIGRFRAKAARVRVIAYAPIFTVELAARRANLETHTHAPHPQFSFRIHPARANAGYWKQRTSDQETRIRRLLIADLFGRDEHHARERGP